MSSRCKYFAYVCRYSGVDPWEASVNGDGDTATVTDTRPDVRRCHRVSPCHQLVPYTSRWAQQSVVIKHIKPMISFLLLLDIVLLLFLLSVSGCCCIDGSSIHQPIFSCSSNSPDTCPHPVLYIQACPHQTQIKFKHRRNLKTWEINGEFYTINE